MKLALFDLDHTLLPVDSADGWSHFLVRAAGLDAERVGAEIRRHAAEYQAGHFDVEGYLAFQMGLLAQFPRVQLELWRTEFLRKEVMPHLRFESQTLVQKHLSEGDTVALITGTHAFVTAPIAALFGIEHLLAVRPEEKDGEFTGRYLPPHTYGEGKVRMTEIFLAERGQTIESCESICFYSDSINDLPLLERVAAAGGRAIVTNGDAKLRAVATARGWDMLELFETRRAA